VRTAWFAAITALSFMAPCAAGAAADGVPAAAACAATVDLAARSGCLAQLFGSPATYTPPAVARAVTGNWSLTSADGAGGGPDSLRAVLQPWQVSGGGAGGLSPRLEVRCSGTLSVRLSVGKPAGASAGKDVAVRIGARTPTVGDWDISDDRKEIVMRDGAPGEGAMLFVREIIASGSPALAVRFDGGEPVTAAFNTTGAREVLRSVIGACRVTAG
jgi:hypothetical protein